MYIVEDISRGHEIIIYFIHYAMHVLFHFFLSLQCKKNLGLIFPISHALCFAQTPLCYFLLPLDASDLRFQFRQLHLRGGFVYSLSPFLLILRPYFVPPKPCLFSQHFVLLLIDALCCLSLQNASNLAIPDLRWRIPPSFSSIVLN